LDLDKILKIGYMYFEIYENCANEIIFTPEIGKELNVPSRITFYNCHPKK